MDRFGLFVDAGYLLAAGGLLCTGEKRRDRFSCEYASVHSMIVELCQKHSGLSHLRTYWYDGASGTPQPQPTTDQLRIASIPTVKLRLGRIIRGQQKGVDSMITRDLMTLARERAMAVAYLVAGDEDLREAVIAAQDLGVQVILIGVEPVPGLNNQSFTLINECDANMNLTQAILAPHFRSTTGTPTLEPEPLLEPIIEVKSDRTEDEIAEDLGRRFCESWLDTEGLSSAKLFQHLLPELPRDVDAPLLRQAEGVFGSLRFREELRRRVRQAFIRRLEEAFRATPTEDGAPA